MNIQVRYYSRGGNTKKVAEAIAEELGVEALNITNPVEGADLLFLGNSMYAFTIDKNVKKFVGELKVENTKEIVNFSTSASDSSTHKKVNKCIKDKNIKLNEKHLSIPGEFLKMNKGRPNEEDLKAAKKFAREIVDSLAKE